MSDVSDSESPSKLGACSSDSLPSPSSSFPPPLVARVQHLGSLDPRNAELASPQGSHSGRGRTKNKDEKWCGVCGDKALGYNFDAISCESCKAFFRRNANKGVDAFKCPYNGECKMDRINRRFCKRCRLKKCFEIGMRKEYILSEEEKSRKRTLIEHNRRQREMRKVNTGSFPSSASVVSGGESSSGPHANKRLSLGSIKSEPSSVSSGGSGGDASRSPGSLNAMSHRGPSLGGPSPSLASAQVPFALLMAANGSAGDVTVDSVSPYVLTGIDQQLIDEVVRAYKNSLNITVPKEPPREAASNLPDLINIAEVSIRRVINMCKNISVFRKLSRDDQTSLLKGGSIELLVLRSALTFDKEKDRFLDPTDREDISAMTTEQLKRAELATNPIGPQIFEQHFGLISCLVKELNADEITMILLLVICLFSPDRSGLADVATVSEVQERYSLLLQKYLYSIYDKETARYIFPKLLMKLVNLRELNEMLSPVLVQVNQHALQPLMQEVLNIDYLQKAKSPTVSTSSSAASLVEPGVILPPGPYLRPGYPTP